MKKTHGKSILPLLAVVCIALVLVSVTMVQMLEPNRVSPSESTISQIASEPTDWENKTVRICGIVQNISLGIIQPFNYWLCDKQNQTMRIGIKCHSDTDLSGKSGGIVGVVKKGYAWVNPNFPSWLTYYIDATSICQDWPTRAC